MRNGLERHNENCSADSNPDADQSTQSEEPAHLPFGKGTNSGDLLDAGQRICHQPEGMRHNPSVMRFRSHLARDFDVTVPSNVVAIVAIALSGIAAVIIILNGGDSGLWVAPGAALLYWALAREIDPDHPWTAMVAGPVGALWTLVDGPGLSLLAVGALMVGARIVVGTTGRRSLLSDWVVVGIGAIAISYTVSGWIGGFTLAVAMAIDGARQDDQARWRLVIPAIAAIAATVVLTAADGLPTAPWDIDPAALALVGGLGLILVLRGPVAPTSIVDARHGATLDQRQLHLGRATVAIASVAVTAAAGLSLSSVAPLVLTLGLVVVSNELDPGARA